MAKNEYPCTDVQPVLIYGYDGALIRRIHTNVSGEPYVAIINGIVTVEHDEIVLSYTGENVTGVVYKLATATVATLTLTYTAGNLTRVVRT